MKIIWYLLSKIKNPKFWVWKLIFKTKLQEYNKLLINGIRNDRFYCLEKFLCESFACVQNPSWKEIAKYKYRKSKQPAQWEFSDNELKNILK